MPIWLWILIAIGLWVCVSVVVGFALARVLGRFERQASRAHEPEEWAMRPPSRSPEDVEERAEGETKERASRGRQR